jgi:peptidyl-dipeptidase Dcp
MKTKFILFMVAITISGGLTAGNPLLENYNTVHQTIPFDKIKTENYFPAFEAGMEQNKKEIAAIINNEKPADFQNTIEALEKSGKLLSKVSSPFFNLLSSETNDEYQAIAQKISPLLTEHSNSIRLNEKLFQRVKAVYEQKDKLKLNAEQKMLLQKTYDGFADNGANLSEKEKESYRELTKELSMLSLVFGQNALKENNQWSLVIDNKDLLKGLPADVIDMLAINAKKANKKGWLINLKATSYGPVMKYADNRDLRRELYMAYSTRNMNGGEYDNRENIRKIANTRLKIANLLGHATYADYVLVHRMAENKENVNHLLQQLLEAYKPTALKEYAEVQDFANKNGAYFKIQSWDWSYYSEKLKAEKFDLTDEMLKPYFELENVRKGVFDLATKLYGITFVKNTKIPVYNSEVDAYDVLDEKGKFLSVLYTDFHPRDSKRSGAWMNEFKGQFMNGTKDSRPQITIVMNFTRPTETKPALLTFDELTTFLHEFGHSLHGMLTKCSYESLSGTSVYRDFVELPSQVMENWASEKDFLDGFAVHYKTGEKIPAELIKKIKDAENFNNANLCLRQLSFGLLDMTIHTITQPYEGDVIALEKSAMNPTQILPVINESASSPTFGHIFSGGYAAGYYSYKWAEVLDADAYSVFMKNGIFDKKTADSFRKNVLMKGGTEHPMTLYKRFRGQEPTIDALLKRNNIN